MLKSRYFVLLAALSLYGGTATAQSNPPQLDAGTRADATILQSRDGGDSEHKPVVKEGEHRHGKSRLLATLDGRAIVAAHAAIRDLRDRFVKEDKRNAGSCGSSPKAMEVLIFEAEDMYVVRINWRLDRCGWADPSFNAAFDPEFYAVSPEGKFLVRNPYTHEVPLVRKPLVIDGIRWPEEARLLAILDGRAVVASYVAMEGFRTRFVREEKSARGYNPSPKDVDVLVFELEDIYAVRITPRAGTRGWVDPNLHVGLEPEVFVVSPEGKLLGRFPDSLTLLLQPVLRMSPGRMGERYPVRARTDAGAHISQPAADGGVGWPEGVIHLRTPATDGGIRWPDDMLPLAILDAPAIVAANAALQHLQAWLSKKDGGACASEARDMQILVGRKEGLYFVSIERHGNRCGAADAGSSTGSGETALYAVSPEGQVQLLNPGDL